MLTTAGFQSAVATLTRTATTTGGNRGRDDQNRDSTHLRNSLSRCEALQTSPDTAEGGAPNQEEDPVTVARPASAVSVAPAMVVTTLTAVPATAKTVLLQHDDEPMSPVAIAHTPRALDRRDGGRHRSRNGLQTSIKR